MSLGRSEPLVPEMDRKLKALPQLFGKLLNFCCLRAGAATQAQGMSHNDFAHFMCANDALQALQIGTLAAALQSFQALRGDAQWIADGQADPPCAYIERENSFAKRSFGHASIIGVGKGQTRIR